MFSSKSRCRAVTNNGDQCTKSAARFSQYCWHHRETGWLLSFVVAVVALIGMFVIFFVQERFPKLSATCEPPSDGDPSQLHCRIENEGRGPAGSVTVSFGYVLPLETKARAEFPDLAVEIKEAELPPDPHRAPELSKFQMAFVVSVPHVPARTTVRFDVGTTDPDNLRAARQVQRIRKEIDDILTQFDERLRGTHPEQMRGWNFSLIKSARTKEDNFLTSDPPPKTLKIWLNHV